jgi:hypothetical protein
MEIDMHIEPGTFVEITSGPNAGFFGTFEFEWVNPQGELIYVVLDNPADDEGEVYYATSIRAVKIIKCRRG